MSASGAKVLMLRAVEMARGHGVRIHARSTFSGEPGTWIQDAEGMEESIVSAVTHSEDEIVFALSGVPDEPGSAAGILEAVAAEHVSVDTILQNVAHGAAEISFSVPREDASAARRALARAQESIGAFEVEEIADLGKVSLVGAGMRSNPGVAARMFRHPGRRGHQPPADLDLSDQDLVPRRSDRRGPSGQGAPRDVPGRLELTRSIVAWVVFVVAGLLLLLSSFAVWVDRVALNTDEFVDTSTELIEDDAIRTAVATQVVDELFALGRRRGGDRGRSLPED